MPAYFSLNIELSITPNAVKHFLAALQKSGATFKCGYWDGEHDSLEEIIAWNQKYIERNTWCLDKNTQQWKHKQFLFDYDGFSECRLYTYPLNDENTFLSRLIIPEDDFYEYTRVNGFLSTYEKRDRMESVKQLALRIWEYSQALSIQTEWECSDCAPHYMEIVEGTPPQVEPFCIIPAKAYREEWNMTCAPIARNGALIENEKNWFYN